MKNAISNDLRQRNNSTELKASFLDPRVRDQYVEEKDVTIEPVKLECLLLIPTTTAAVASERDPENLPPPKKAQGLAAVHLNIYSEPEDRQTPLTHQPTVENEIVSYQTFPKTTPETDPLVWWKGEGGRFPNLAWLARKYLSVCCTSVP